MNPLEDAIVALRPTAPKLPFKLPDSIRPLDPTQPVGATFEVTDPTNGNRTTVTNALTNFGWEYVWHCHLLGHEENDMMRPFTFRVSPAAPSSLAGAPNATPGVDLTWTNNATVPAATNLLLQRADDAAFTTGLVETNLSAPATASSDTGVQAAHTYYYRLRAENSVSYSTWTNAVQVTLP